MESVVTSDSTMSSLSLNSSVWTLKDRGHESKRSESLGNDIRLDISIVVLASPYESSIGLNSVSNHIINESVLVPKSLLFELLLVVLFIDLLEDILKSSVILLEDGVLGGEIAWIVSVESIGHGGMSKVSD